MGAPGAADEAAHPLRAVEGSSHGITEDTVAVALAAASGEYGLALGAIVDGGQPYWAVGDPSAGEAGLVLLGTTRIIPVRVEEAPTAPTLHLSSPAPHPVRATAEIHLDLPVPGAVRVTVMDLLGREVDVLFAGSFAAGTHPLHLDVSSFAPGLYVLKAQTRGGAATKPFVVVR